MTEQRPPEGNIADEFRQLGKTIAEAFQLAWDSPERKRFQQEVSAGLNELGRTLKEEANYISESPAGQRLRNEAEDLRTRVRTGEVEAKMREELLTALQTVNNELREAMDKWAESRRYEPNQGSASSSQGSGGHQEVHPDDMTSGTAKPPHQETHPDDVGT